MSTILVLIFFLDKNATKDEEQHLEAVLLAMEYVVFVSCAQKKCILSPIFNFFKYEALMR